MLPISWNANVWYKWKTSLGRIDYDLTKTLFGTRFLGTRPHPARRALSARPNGEGGLRRSHRARAMGSDRRFSAAFNGPTRGRKGRRLGRLRDFRRTEPSHRVSELPGRK